MMWDAYANPPDSVAVLTTRSGLDHAIKQRMMKHAVTYINENRPRTEFGNASLLLYKDDHYKFEQEFRLLVSIDDLNERSIRDNDPSDFFRRIPVNLPRLIDAVAVSPYAIGATNRKITGLIQKYAPFLLDAG